MYVPTESPCSTSRSVVSRATDVLPFVPVTWITGQVELRGPEQLGEALDPVEGRVRRAPGLPDGGVQRLEVDVRVEPGEPVAGRHVR